MNIIILDNHKLIITEIRRQVLSVLPTAECICFTKQREAIEYVRKNRVEVALLDVDMPGLNGIEVAELMCQISPRLNIMKAFHVISLLLAVGTTVEDTIWCYQVSVQAIWFIPYAILLFSMLALAPALERGTKQWRT